MIKQNLILFMYMFSLSEEFLLLSIKYGLSSYLPNIQENQVIFLWELCIN
jgi:hypothetical protein